MSKRSHGVLRRGRLLNTITQLILVLLLLGACGAPSTSSTPGTPVAGSTPVVLASPSIFLSPTTGAAARATIDPTTLVADLGFRPEVNGFSFPNYGTVPGRAKLTPAEVRRLFGDVVCVSVAGDHCTLIPEAQLWMERINGYLGGGHCEGLATLSLLFYLGKEQPGKFTPGTTKAADLKIDDNTLLQREIAYWFSTQVASPTVDNEIKDKTPSEILDLLLAAFEQHPASESYTMGIYRPGYIGGHSLTPYAVQDKGSGLFAVLLYDNNYPGTTGSLTIDRNTNTWSYFAATRPDIPGSEYMGDAETKTLTLTRISARLEQHVCNFCANGSQGNIRGNYLAAPEAAAGQYNQVWVEGIGDLLLTDPEGHRMGYVDGRFVNEIPGGWLEPVRSADLWDVNLEPIYNMPATVPFTATLDGSRLTADELDGVAMIGRGYTLAVEKINLHAGQKDTMQFSADGRLISYHTERAEAPDIDLGVETPGVDYIFKLRHLTLDGGGTIHVELDREHGQLDIFTNGLKSASTFMLQIERDTGAGPEIFHHDHFTVEPNDILRVDYAHWSGKGKDVDIEIDDMEGHVLQQLHLSDEPVPAGEEETP
jgi:hypothetical protein